MDISGVSTKPIMNQPPTQPSVMQELHSAPVDQTVPIMTGQQARPPIENIASQILHTSPAPQPPVPQQPIPPVQVGPTDPGLQAQAAQAVAQQEQDEVQRKEKSAKAKTSRLQVSEAQVIKGMKESIKEKTNRVARQVNRSAFKYIFKETDWLNKEKAREAEEFFTFKVPKVLASELNKILIEALGLEEAPEE